MQNLENIINDIVLKKNIKRVACLLKYILFDFNIQKYIDPRTKFMSDNYKLLSKFTKMKSFQSQITLCSEYTVLYLKMIESMLKLKI